MNLNNKQLDAVWCIGDGDESHYSYCRDQQWPTQYSKFLTLFCCSGQKSPHEYQLQLDNTERNITTTTEQLASVSGLPRFNLPLHSQ